MAGFGHHPWAGGIIYAFLGLAAEYAANKK